MGVESDLLWVATKVIFAPWQNDVRNWFYIQCHELENAYGTLRDDRRKQMKGWTEKYSDSNSFSWQCEKRKSVPSLNYHWKSHKCASVFLCCQNLTTIHNIFLRFIPFGHRFLTISINLTIEALVVFTRQNFSKWHKGEMIVFSTELQGSILKCIPTSKQRSKCQRVIACIWPKLFAKNLMSQFQDYVGHPITEKSRSISFPFH